MDRKTYKALGIVLRAANAFAQGREDKQLDDAINLVWYWMDHAQV